jgi:hypothetical protein
MKQILDILNDFISTLEEMNNEKNSLKSLYKRYNLDVLQDQNMSEDDLDFYADLIDITSEHITVDDFSQSDMMKYLYNANKSKIQILETQALKLYKLYTDEYNDDKDKIAYLETLKSKKAQEIEIINEKPFLTVSEFEIIFGYSPTQQKGFRQRINDPIPFTQKALGHKILYSRKKVEIWLEN